jgi:hypothetical protein
VYLLHQNDLVAQTKYYSISGHLPKITGEKQSPIRTVDEENKNSITVHYDFPGYSLTDVKRNGVDYKLVKIPGFGLTTDVGSPALPVRSDKVAIPAGSEGSVTIVKVKFIELDNIIIYPVQQILPDGDPVTSINWKEDRNSYSQDAFMPQDIVVIRKVQKLRGTPLAFIEIYPVQYNPVQKKIKIYSEIVYRIEFHPDAKKKLSDTDLRAAKINPCLQNIIINSPDRQSILGGNKALYIPQGYIIITHSDYLEAAEALANWKRQLGYNVEVVTQSSWTTTQIKNVLNDRYYSWDPAPSYFVIIGDQEDVPDEEYSYDEVTWYSSLYYACMDGYGDYIPEMASGRIAVKSESEAMRVIQKIINYEKNPPTESSFYQNAIHCTYFEDDGNGIGYEGYRYTHTTEESRDYMVGQGYTIQRIYYTEPEVNPLYYNNGYFSDGQPLPPELLRANGFTWSGNNQDVIDAMMEGCFYVFHRDHGYPDGWANPRFSIEDVPSLNNSNKLPVIFSINCHTGSFQYDECFAEMILSKDNGGAVGIIAPTQETYRGWNDGLAEGLIDAIWPDPGLIPDFGPAAPDDPEVTPHEPIYTLGDILNQGLFRMTETWPGWAEQITYERYHYFGDPSMNIWTAEPIPITATHPLSVEQGQTSLAISNSNCPDALATVCFNNELIGSVLLENGSGVITFSEPVPEDITEIILTLSKHNYRPYQTILPVAEIMIISPNGGENWHAGISHNITWSSSGSNGNVHIEYSTTNGADWSDVAVNTPDDGSELWTIPNEPSVNCLVRISSISGTPSDISDAVFTISEMPEILIDSLALVALYNSTNGPEWTNNANWLTGPVDTWYGITVENERVTWLHLENNNLSGQIPPEIGNLFNLQDLVISNNELIYLPSLMSLPYLDNLTINYNKLSFEDIEPNLGVASTSFIYSPQDSVGESQYITTFEGDNAILNVIVGGNHNLYQWFKDGEILAGEQTNTLEITNTDPDDGGLYTCQITNSLAIELTLYSRTIILTIETPEINVSVPNGGEHWQIGKNKQITWNSSGTSGTVHIEYSVNNGTDWIGITSSTPDDGSYTWTIPDDPSDNCLIRITDTDGIPSDQSDSLFIISPDPPQHFFPVWTGNGQDHMNFYAKTARIDGVDMQPFDEIGIFDGSYCVGAGRLTEVLDTVNALEIRVSRDDDYTPEKDGYTPGNTASFKLWDASDEHEYNNVENTYVIGNNIFAIGASTWYHINGIPTLDHNIALNYGWNIFSLYIEPDDIAMMSILAPLINEGSLIKVQNEAGAAIEPIPGTGSWIDNIHNWANTEGYKIRVNSNTPINVTGIPIELPLTIGLTSGWNIISYPSSTSRNAMDALDGLVNSGNLLKVQNESGAAIEPIPGTGSWIDNIHNFLPGEGYKVRVLTDDELTFNNEGKMTAIQENITSIETATHFTPCWEGNGLDHMNIYLSIANSDIQAGDEIGIFDGQYCVGAGRIVDPNLEFISLVVSADDPTTSEKDGFTAGNAIEIKIRNSVTKQESNLTDIEYLYGTTYLFEPMGTVMIQLRSAPNEIPHLDATLTWLGDNYPNPFNASTLIPFTIGEKTTVELALYDILGQRIATLLHETLLPGSYKAEWKGTDSTNTKVMPGIYFIKMVAANKVFVKTVELYGN